MLIDVKFTCSLLPDECIFLLFFFIWSNIIVKYLFWIKAINEKRNKRKMLQWPIIVRFIILFWIEINSRHFICYQYFKRFQFIHRHNKKTKKKSSNKTTQKKTLIFHLVQSNQNNIEHATFTGDKIYIYSIEIVCR